MDTIRAVMEGWHSLPLVLKVLGLCIVAGFWLMKVDPKWRGQR